MPAAFASTGAVVGDNLQPQRYAKLQTVPTTCSSWLDQPEIIWGELVNKRKVASGTLQHSPQPDSGSADAVDILLSTCLSSASNHRNVLRPKSCPGGISSATVTAGTARTQRPSTSGNVSMSKSFQGLEVYCTSMQLVVSKRIRHHSSSKRCVSAGGRRSSSGNCSSEQASDSLAACIPSSSRVAANRPKSIGGCQPAAVDSTQVHVAHHSGSDTGRAVGLALSLRDRVLQLERRNRALEKKLKSITAASHAPQAGSETHQHAASTETRQQQQQQQIAVQPKAQPSLQICVLPTLEVAPQLTSSSSSSSDELPLASVTPMVSASNNSDGTAADAEVAIKMQSMMECDIKADSKASLQHGEDSCSIASSSSSTSTTTSSSSSSSSSSGVGHVHDAAGSEQLTPGTPELASNSSSTGSIAAAPGISEQQQLQQQTLLLEHQQQQRTITCLQQQLGHMQMLHGLLQSDYADLEFVLKETERQRHEYAARYAFVVTDTDGDGYISVEQVESYDLFACYSPQLLRAAFAAWRWQSGFPGFLNMEDFVRFTEYAEDRSSVEAQRFWFSVLDADGDGRLGWQDMKEAYDAVDKSSARYVVTFEDLMNQIRDMVSQQMDPHRGFTFAELRESKLGSGVLGLLANHNNMLLQRSTAEWGRGEYPL